jgi:hypothetical protein
MEINWFLFVKLIFVLLLFIFHVLTMMLHSPREV